jgi:hypothetical protein
MGVTHQKVMGTTMLGLAVLSLSWPFALGAEQAQAEQKSSDQLLMEIVDLHSRLVTNDVFLAQAKMLGAYLESAQPMEESKKAAIYRSVLGMLEKIKESSAQVSATPPQEKVKPEQKPKEEKQSDKVVYTPGAALLEVFKTDSMNNIPPIPITRAYWKNDLACNGGYLLPGQINEIGEGSPYVARFLFYYEAKQSGMYGFTITHVSGNAFKLTVGNDVIASSERRPGSFGAGLTDMNQGRVAQAVYNSQYGLPVVRVQRARAGGEIRGSVQQGTANLEKGFHRVEFWLASRAYRGGPSTDASFEVKVHPPDSFNPVPLTKNMMLLRADQVKVPQAGQQKGASGQAVPYVDY